MTNLYHTNFVAAHVQNAKQKSDKNAIKANVIAARLTDDRVTTMLAASLVDARDMSLALYTTEKTVDLHSYLLNISSKQCDNLTAALRTVVNCYVNDCEVTERDIAASILIDVHASDDRKHLVYKRANAISADAQRQYVIAALRQMQIIEETTRNSFKINMNATLLAFCAAHELDIEETIIEAEMLEIEALETVEIVDSENASA